MQPAATCFGSSTHTPDNGTASRNGSGRASLVANCRTVLDEPPQPCLRAAPGWALEFAGRIPDILPEQDVVMARLNLRGFIESWPYEPEDLRDDTGPVLVGCTLPRCQIVCDAHSPAGLQSAGLPNTYPLEIDSTPVSHVRCQTVGTRAKEAGLRGVRARSARSPDGAGRELAWFPATNRSVARRVQTLAYSAWLWA